MTQFINLTPHALNLNDGRVFAPSGTVARVQVSFSPFEGDVCSQVFGDVEGLPAPQDGVVYIVSAIVLAALRGGRADVVAPATGHPACVRENGQIKSVPGFVRG